MTSAAHIPPSATEDQSGGDEELLTTREVMAFLNLSRTRIWELVKRERPGPPEIGTAIRRDTHVLPWLARWRRL